MKNKQVILNKIERLERVIKNIEYNLNTNNRREALESFDILKEKLGDIQTLINTEVQG